MGIRTDGSAWPSIGSEKRTTYGGVSGNATRPMALRDVSAIARALPGYPIMGVGGIDSADVAVQFFYCGASVVQICSAVQNQDFTVIEDYILGLKCHLYMQSRPDLRLWVGQSPPKGLVPYKRNPIGAKLPKFGHFVKERQQLIRQANENKDLLVDGPVRKPEPKVERVETLKEQVGKAVDRIGAYNKLNNKEQAVALVNEELCINCGKCYMTCNDSGYQAIRFDAETHIPFITDDCTGCTLCVSVCPIIGK
jgi:dihydropyrimidine dehydrogenase (NADP+)